MSKEEMDVVTKLTVHGQINDIMQDKEPVLIEDIGKPNGITGILPKCILVEGAPGVGKSTFAWKLCRKWSKRKLLHPYRLVVLLRLRDKKVREARNISDLFHHYNHSIQQAVAEEIQSTGGNGVLLLFDGYDELPDSLRSRTSIFMDILFGQELPEATVLITSRPSTNRNWYMECKNSICQHVEILGFTQEGIQCYLESVMGKTPLQLQELQDYLMYYPNMSSMLYIPLNCAIVVEVYKANKRMKSLLPKTKTDLYSSLIRSLLLRYLDDHSEHQRQSWTSNNFCDLPAEIYKQLCELSKTAYDGILHDHVIFSDLNRDFESLGLMQCIPELYVDEIVAESYNFLHITVQEYMAALYLSEQPVEVQIEHFKDYHSKEHSSYSRFQAVLRFLAGLKKFASYSTDSVRLLLTNSRPSECSTELVITLDALHWIFEAQDTSNACQAIGTHTLKVEPHKGLTPFDCFVLGYCVSHSTCSWKIDFYSCRIGDEEVEMLVRGALELEGKATNGSYISEMDLGYNEITCTGIDQLLRIPVLLNSLNVLNLVGNPLGSGGAVSLLKSSLALSMKSLNLKDTGIDTEDCRALSELLSSLTLEKVSISLNSSDSVGVVITGLQQNCNLKEMDMVNSQFSLQNCISLASVLRKNSSLQKLSLPCCSVDADGASELAASLTMNSMLQHLDMWGNPVGIEGAAAFAQLLKQNNSLKSVNLRHESIGPEGTQKLIDSLSYNTILEQLMLPWQYNIHEPYRNVCGRICWL